MPKPALDLDIDNITVASELYRPDSDREGPASFDRQELAGRLVELSGHGASAAMSVAVGLLHEVQMAGEPVAWVCGADGVFYPPDVADAGVDLRALPVVRVGDAHAAGRAADKLVRSGAFGLIVIDLTGESEERHLTGKTSRRRLPDPLVGRLKRLAERHETILLCLTDKPRRASSLSAMVSLRAQAERSRIADNRFRCRVDILKDRRRGPGWSFEEVCRGPTGVR